MSTSTSAGSVMIAAMHRGHDHAVGGHPVGADLDHSWCPGTARSRLNANNIRDALVWQAVVQKNCPAVEMNSTIAAHLVSSA